MKRIILFALAAFAVRAQGEQVKTISADLLRPNPPFIVTTAARTTPLIRAMIERDRVPYVGVTNWSAVFFYASSPSSMLGMAVTNVATGRTWFDFRLNADQTAVPGRYFSQLILYGPATQEWVRGTFTIEPGGGTGPFAPMPWNATNVYNAMEVDGLFEAFSNRLANVAWTGESDPVFGASPASGISTSQLAQWDAAFSWGNHAGAALGGDATGTLGSVNIVALRGAPIAPIAPTDGQALVWRDDLSAYVPGVVSGGGGGGDITVDARQIIATPANLVLAMGGVADDYTESFIGTNRVGIYRKMIPAGNGAMSFAVDGVEVGYFSSNGLSLYRGTLELFEDALNVNVRAYDGSAAAPAFAFKAEPGRGWWHRPYAGDRVWTYSHDGTNVLWLDALGLHVESNRWLDAAVRPHSGSAAAPALSYPVSTGRSGWYRFEGPNDWAWGFAHGSAGLRLWIDQHGLHLTNGASVFGVPLGGGGTVTNETDPVFATSIAARVTAPATQRWEQAHAWGNHAVAGYLTSAPAYAPNAGTSTFAAVAGQVTSTVAKSLSAYRLLDPTADTVSLEINNNWLWIKSPAGEFRLPSTNDFIGMVTNGQENVVFDYIQGRQISFDGHGINVPNGSYKNPSMTNFFYFTDIGKWAGMALDIKPEHESDWLVLFKAPGVSQLQAKSLQGTMTNAAITVYNALRLGGIDAARFATNAGSAGSSRYVMSNGAWAALSPEVHWTNVVGLKSAATSDVPDIVAAARSNFGLSQVLAQGNRATNDIRLTGKMDINAISSVTGTYSFALSWAYRGRVANGYSNPKSSVFYAEPGDGVHGFYGEQSGNIWRPVFYGTGSTQIARFDALGDYAVIGVSGGNYGGAFYGETAGLTGYSLSGAGPGVFADKGGLKITAGEPFDFGGSITGLSELARSSHTQSWTTIGGLQSAATSTVASIRSGLFATNAAWAVNTQQWGTAYAWGNHAEAGYQKVGTSTFARVSVADQSRLGVNLATNSGFNSSAAGWILGGGASWNDSRIYCPFGQETILAPSNALPLQTGRFYRVQFDLYTANSSEFVTLRMGGQTNTWGAGPNRSVDALVWTRTTSNLHLSVKANASSVYVDNVAVYPVAEGDIRAAGSVWAAENIYLGGRSITNLAAEAAAGQVAAYSNALAAAQAVPSTGIWTLHPDGRLRVSATLMAPAAGLWLIDSGAIVTGTNDVADVWWRLNNGKAETR